MITDSILCSFSCVVFSCTDRRSVGYDVQMWPHVREKGRLIYICTEQTFTDGRLISFSAYFAEPGPNAAPVRFQIWRPVKGAGSATVVEGNSDGSNTETLTIVKEAIVQPEEGLYQVINEHDTRTEILFILICQ